MRIFILTSVEKDIASRCVPVLAGDREVELVAVVLAKTHTSNRRRLLRRKLKKMVEIGPFGALNGIRMRSWYADPTSVDIREIASEYDVPLLERDVINSDEMRATLRSLDCDLGVSLGNGFIAPSVFRIPKHGMINLHMEILPRFRGAQSIIWPIHDELAETGFTIHQIARTIDSGEILYQERMPIDFCEDLESTVRHNLSRQRELIPDAVARVCREYPSLQASAVPQGSAPSYTTPSWREFRRMRRNHERMRRDSV